MWCGRRSGLLGFAVGLALAAAAQPALATVSPILECVVQTPSGYVAWYGYKSFASSNLTIPVGALNKFVPNPINRGQPTTFLPGRRSFVFSVPFASGSLSWKLALQSANASASSPRCAALTPAAHPASERRARDSRIRSSWSGAAAWARSATWSRDSRAISA